MTKTYGDMEAHPKSSKQSKSGKLSTDSLSTSSKKIDSTKRNLSNSHNFAILTNKYAEKSYNQT